MYCYSDTEAIARDVARLQELGDVLDARAVLPRRWAGRLRRDLEADSVAASTSMEGVPVTVDEVRRILAGDRPKEVSQQDAELVRGYRDAMALVLRRADDPDFGWEPEIIRGIHDRVMAGRYDLGAGRFRSGAAHVAVGSRLLYTAPEPDRVPGLVAELADWLASTAGDYPVPVAASLAHVRVAGVNPFSDGNGRTARVLSSLVMYRGGYRLPEFTSLEEWWGAHRDTYYAAFDCLGSDWDPDADVTPFVAAHVAAQRAQVEALSLRQATEGAIWTVLEDMVVEDLGSPPRMAEALFDAFFGREVTNRYYRGLTDIGAVTASQDLQRLLAAGLLEVRGAGRSTSYRGTARLVTTTADALGFDTSQYPGTIEEQRSTLVARLAELVRGGLCLQAEDRPARPTPPAQVD